jgi:DNA gyrase subunit B
VQIAGADLERLLQKMMAHQKLLQTVERRGHSREIIQALLSAGADREYFADRERVGRLAETLTTAGRSVTVQRDEEHNLFLLQIDDRSSGYPRQDRIGHDVVTTAEYRTLLANHREMPPFDGEIVVSWVPDGSATSQPGSGAASPAATSSADDTSGAGNADGDGDGNQPKPAQTPDVRLRSRDELIDFFLTAGKKGVAVNRYKGLGEMNPEQLWATTMDPKVRTLLQVRAEDHTEADLMFTTLMGDQVEPRRKFIEDNALDVKNLDV